jgi:hypothetical protein|tara:strand:- start:294 stop:602 length:309 start_codon:yes stop_codon:yes gene_type:complete
MGHKLFDRHECFTSEMMTMTHNCIVKLKRNNRSLENKLYGLYDGYLYNDLLPNAIELGVDKKIEDDIRSLVEAVELFIQTTSEVECSLQEDMAMANESENIQ